MSNERVKKLVLAKIYPGIRQVRIGPRTLTHRYLIPPSRHSAVL